MTLGVVVVDRDASLLRLRERLRLRRLPNKAVVGSVKGGCEFEEGFQAYNVTRGCDGCGL